MIRSFWLALSLILIAALPARSFECHTGLILALDASDSVDEREATLQRRGLAFALTDPEVMEALAPNPDYGTLAMIFEWGGVGAHRVLADWSRLDRAATINDFASHLMNDDLTLLGGQTAIGSALEFAVAAMARQQVPCRRLVIDVSGDGPGNIGTSPATLRSEGLFDGLIINGLVIRQDPAAYLQQQPTRDPLPYYETEVRQGVGSFVMITNNFEDYGITMRRKLLRELRPTLAGVSE